MNVKRVSKVAAAFLLAPAAAVLTLSFLVFVLWHFAGSDPNPPWRAAMHFGLYGTLIIYPVSLGIGVPAFVLFQRLGWLSRKAVFVGGALLSVAYPAFAAVQNTHQPGTVQPLYYVVCLACGLVASWVFCAVSGMPVQGGSWRS